VDQVNALVKGGLWSSSAIFITWDDWGGWYDHVVSPNVERWNGNTHPSYKGSQFRYGSRVGCLVLSPYAKTGYTSLTWSTQQDACFPSIVGMPEKKERR
jgi:phospholipase C